MPRRSGPPSTTPTHRSVALRDLPRRHVSGCGHVSTVCSGLRHRLPPGVALAVISRSPAGSMEDEDEEARALLPGGSDEAGRETRAAPAASGALQALCDPSRLAHRLVVLLLMCFLGFGEPAGLVGWDWSSRNSRLSRSCAELLGPPALPPPPSRPHSSLLLALQCPEGGGSRD